MLTLAPPAFPVQFHSTSPPDEAATAIQSTSSVAWPRNDYVGDDDSAVDTAARGAEEQWKLQSEREKYIESLESKMHHLSMTSAAAATTSTSNRSRMSDSGFGSSSGPASDLYDNPSPAARATYDMEHDDFAEGDAEGIDQDVAYERRATEWIDQQSGEGRVGNEAEDDGDVGSGREGEGLLWHHSTQHHDTSRTPISCSPTLVSEYLLIPPTPSTAFTNYDSDINGSDVENGNDYDDKDERGRSGLGTRRRAAAGALIDLESRRISFSASVRISGGIRSHKQARRQLSHDMFSPSSTSAHPRDASSSTSSSLGLGASGPHPPSHSRFATPTSGVSRSSSPCSSIYAPLQPPSDSCPALNLARSTASLSMSFASAKTKTKADKGSTARFREYLLGGRRGREEASDDEENEVEEGVRGYHDLVQRQRRKKVTHRSLTDDATAGIDDASALENAYEAEGLWSKVRTMFRRGPSSASFSRSRAAAAASSSTKNYGSTDSPTRRTARRTHSRLSISSLDADDERDELGARVLPPSSSKPKSRPRKATTKVAVDKSADDVMYGPTHERWLRLDYWRERMRRVGNGLLSCFGFDEDRIEDQMSR